MPLLGRSRSIRRSSCSSAPFSRVRSSASVRRCTQAGRVTYLDSVTLWLPSYIHLACSAATTSAVVLAQCPLRVPPGGGGITASFRREVPPPYPRLKVSRLHIRAVHVA